MRSAGYTLIELLIVISIIALMSIMGFVAFKNFASNQILVKAKGQIQSLLKLAQSNATSSTLCGTQGATSWSLKFNTISNSTSIELRCDPGNFLPRPAYALENAKIDQIKGTGCAAALSFPVTFNYKVGVGTLTIDPPETCLSNASSIDIKLSNINNSSMTDTLKMSKGGAVDVQ